MSRLLTVHFSRMWKNKLFWGEMLFMFVLGIFCVITVYRARLEGSQMGLDATLQGYPMMIGFLSALFCGVFGGTEYSDGTIRNKLIAGHTRWSDYLSSLIVHSAQILLCLFSFLLADLALGLPLLGGFVIDERILLMLAGSIVTMLAFSAIFTLISMLCQNKTTGVCICLILFCVMFFMAMDIAQRLEEPEYYEGYTYMTDAGVTEHEDAQPNPNYLTGTKREAYEFLQDFLPCNQMYQYTMMHSEIDTRRLMLYSLSIIIVVTAAGIFVFRKKDVK
ncbi:MAG: ABC transporter permease subunit [Eubacterium sp.]|nr:ABC transporter permease subunit [Eubacterium sp.]